MCEFLFILAFVDLYTISSILLLFLNDLMLLIVVYIGVIFYLLFHCYLLKLSQSMLPSPLSD